MYLLKTVPQETIALFLFSYTSAKLGSYAAETSAERQSEDARTFAEEMEADSAVAEKKMALKP